MEQDAEQFELALVEGRRYQWAASKHYDSPLDL
jgi:hypothetical protein